jgi:hypothetical protein
MRYFSEIPQMVRQVHFLGKYAMNQLANKMSSTACGLEGK